MLIKFARNFYIWVSQWRAVSMEINIINCKFYSDFISIKYNRNAKHRKSARLTTKEVKERYYPEYRYAVVSVGLGNYPLWICKDIDEAKERVKCSCQRLHIVYLGDVE